MERGSYDSLRAMDKIFYSLVQIRVLQDSHDRFRSLKVKQLSFKIFVSLEKIPRTKRYLFRCNYIRYRFCLMAEQYFFHDQHYSFHFFINGKIIHPVRFSCCCCNDLETFFCILTCLFYLFSIIYDCNDVNKLTRNVAYWSKLNCD